MSTNEFTYRVGAELPGLILPWQEETAPDVWTDINFTTGYTFTLELVRLGAVVVSKTSGLTGALGKVIVSWDVGQLAIAVGAYSLKLRARETATTKDRDYSPDVPVVLKIVP